MTKKGKASRSAQGGFDDMLPKKERSAWGEAATKSDKKKGGSRTIKGKGGGKKSAEKPISPNLLEERPSEPATTKAKRLIAGLGWLLKRRGTEFQGSHEGKRPG